MQRRHFCQLLTGITLNSVLGDELALAYGRSQPLALPSGPLKSLAFGSCNRSHKSQSFWQTISKQTPDLWISLGDNIYGDGMSMERRRQTYKALKFDPSYSAFRHSTPVVGIWDDHDYAADNQGAEFADKERSKQAFLEFFGQELSGDLATHQGIYQSYNIGPKGQRTKVILLDSRYNMNRQLTQTVVLGDAQWLWLNQEIKTQDYELLIIGTSISLSSEAFGFGVESWSEFPSEKQKLLDLLCQVRCPILVLSGDRHQADFARFKLANGIDIHEFMSSGLTHSLSLDIPNENRVSRLVTRKNFGHVQIDWQGDRPTMKLMIKSPESGIIYEEKTIAI